MTGLAAVRANRGRGARTASPRGGRGRVGGARSLRGSVLCPAAAHVCSRPKNFLAAGSVGQRAPDLALS